jgi:hypothetical protein
MGALVALYEPDEPYPGAVNLLRSTGEGSEDLGWRQWVAGDFQIRPVDMPHSGMMEDAGLRATAQVIEQAAVRAGV